MNNENPFIKPMEPSNKKPEDYIPIKMNDSPKTINREKTFKSLWQLVKSKPSGYQFKDEDLARCEVPPEKQDRVREAITRAGTAWQNPVFSFFGWIFKQIGSFIDTIFRVVLILLVFLLSIQFPYIQEQANGTLERQVATAEGNYQKYEITVKQFAEILSRYKVKENNIEKAIPEQVKKDKNQSVRWLNYKGRTVGSIWRQVQKEPLNSKQRFDDLWFIYGETFKEYKPGLPQQKGAYVNAGIVALAALIIYILLQNLFGALVSNSFKRAALLRELRKVI